MLDRYRLTFPHTKLTGSARISWVPKVWASYRKLGYIIIIIITIIITIILFKNTVM